ncbi:peptidase S8/S53 domain-containing protein [Mycena polygramma]|nr:peptidase S8/S53 domain-containing protein [Mycena polygramma]
MLKIASIILAALLAAPAVSPRPLTTIDCHTDPNSPLHQRPLFTCAPLLGGEEPQGVINDSYIVVLKREYASATQVQNHFNFLAAVQEESPLVGGGAGEGIRHIYDGFLRGYTGRFSETAMHQLRSMPEVDYIEHDRLVHTMDIATQKGTPWGLARISNREKLSFRTYGKYHYGPRGGEGVDVYVVDSGVNIHHDEFEGRASWGKTFVANEVDEDANGHGAQDALRRDHKYGVAKAARIIAVKVMSADGTGSLSDTIAGISYVASAATAKAAAAQKEYEATGRAAHKGSVINMSLGLRSVSRAGNQAINGAVQQGIHVVVAAGNDNADACKSTPGSAERAIVVGASTQTDARAYFSNHGAARAPRPTMSGTSMAAPHAAGLVAYLLGVYPSSTFDPVFGKEHMLLAPAFAPQRLFDVYAVLRAVLPRPLASLLPVPRTGTPSDRTDTLTPAEMKAALIELATRGKLTGLPADTVNLLIFNNATTTTAS